MANVNSDIVAASVSGDNLAAAKSAGNAKTIVAKIALTAATTAADTLTLARVNVEDRIPSLRMWSTDSGTTGTLNIGFHRISEDGSIGAAIDADAIGTEIDIKTAALSNVEQRFETKAISTINQTVWELAGLSAKPAYGECYLTATYAEGADATSGTLAFVVTAI